MSLAGSGREESEEKAETLKAVAGAMT